MQWTVAVFKVYWYVAPAVQTATTTNIPRELEYVCQYNREKKRRGKVRTNSQLHAATLAKTNGIAGVCGSRPNSFSVVPRSHVD